MDIFVVIMGIFALILSAVVIKIIGNHPIPRTKEFSEEYSVSDTSATIIFICILGGGIAFILGIISMIS